MWSLFSSKKWFKHKDSAFVSTVLWLRIRRNQISRQDLCTTAHIEDMMSPNKPGFPTGVCLQIHSWMSCVWLLIGKYWDDMSESYGQTLSELELIIARAVLMIRLLAVHSSGQFFHAFKSQIKNKFELTVRRSQLFPHRSQSQTLMKFLSKTVKPLQAFDSHCTHSSQFYSLF